MLRNDGSQFTTRKEFNARINNGNARADYSFEEYLADSLGLENPYTYTDVIDALISIIDTEQTAL